MFRLRRHTKHAIVCGLGDRGKLIAGKLLMQNKGVVLIESNPDHTIVEPIEGKSDHVLVKTGEFAGAIVVAGDATSPEILNIARVAHASELHVVLGDDNRAVSVAIAAHRLCMERMNRNIRWDEKAWRTMSRTWRKPAAGRLKCLVHVRGADTRELFGRHEVFLENITARVYSRIIDDDRLAARQAMIDYAGKMIAPWWRSEEAPHIVVVGGGWAGQALLVQMAHVFHSGSKQPLHVTVVDEKAESCKEEFYFRYSFIRRENLFNPVFLQCDITRCDDAMLARIKGPEARKIDGVFFCINNERASLSAALQLRRLLDKEGSDKAAKAPIVVCTYSGSGLSELFCESAKDYKGQNIHLCNMTCSACEHAGKMSAAIEGMAEDLHDMWRKDLRPGGKPNPNDVEWENLKESVRDSNRDQAADLFFKLACYGYSFAPGVPDAGQEKWELYPEEECDVLAEMEHRRWMVEKFLDGWVYNEKRNDDLKQHPDLKPFSELKRETQFRDLVPVKATAHLLTKHGYRIQPEPASAAKAGKPAEVDQSCAVAH